MISPGEVYYCDFSERGSRPVIVLSREQLNRGRHVLVVVCTSAKFESRKSSPNNVPFLAGEFGFTADSIAQCEVILSVPTTDLDISAGPLGRLDDTAFRSVIRAIGYVMDSECEPA